MKRRNCPRASWKIPAEPQPCEPAMMASWPWSRFTRESSPATRSSARSHDTGTNGSRPRPSPCPGPAFEPALAHKGCAMRVCECTAAGIASISGDGSGSRSNGRTPTTRPSSTSARKDAPMGMIANELGHDAVLVRRPISTIRSQIPRGEVRSADQFAATARSHRCGTALRPANGRGSVRKRNAVARE